MRSFIYPLQRRCILLHISAENRLQFLRAGRIGEFIQSHLNPDLYLADGVRDLLSGAMDIPDRWPCWKTFRPHQPFVFVELQNIRIANPGPEYSFRTGQPQRVFASSRMLPGAHFDLTDGTGTARAVWTNRLSLPHPQSLPEDHDIDWSEGLLVGTVLLTYTMSRRVEQALSIFDIDLDEPPPSNKRRHKEKDRTPAFIDWLPDPT